MHTNDFDTESYRPESRADTPDCLNAVFLPVEEDEKLFRYLVYIWEADKACVACSFQHTRLCMLGPRHQLALSGYWVRSKVKVVLHPVPGVLVTPTRASALLKK